jgi:hypothetical protein
VGTFKKCDIVAVLGDGAGEGPAALAGPDDDEVVGCRVGHREKEAMRVRELSGGRKAVYDTAPAVEAVGVLRPLEVQVGSRRSTASGPHVPAW